MIIEKTIPDHPNLIKRYSDMGFLIQNDQTGEKYMEAVDIIGLHTYTETTELPDDGYDEELDDSEALNILIGG